MPGYAACVMCHTWQTSLRFDLETPATDAGWTAEQSRQNFEMITQLVNTRTPENSYLLLKPLEPKAGGLGHTGGTYWTSRDDPGVSGCPEVDSQSAGRSLRAGAGAAGGLRVLPLVRAERLRDCRAKDIIRCSNCHSGGAMGFAPLPGEGRSTVERGGGAGRRFA